MNDFNELYVPVPPAPAAPAPSLDASPAHAPADGPVKPPAQVLSVNGVSAPSIVIHDHKVNWSQVAGLPPFQMFIAERDGPNQTGENSHLWATGVAMRLAAAVNDQALLDEYSAWHEAKGYWPGETPLGAPKG